MQSTQVLKNIVKLLKYRGLKNVPSFNSLRPDMEKAIISEDQFTFTVPSEDLVVSVAIKDVKKSVSALTDFMRSLTKYKETNVIIAIQLEIEQDTISTYLEQTKKTITKLEVFPFIYLAMNYPKKVNMPKYKIVQKDKVPELLESLRLESIKLLPPMYKRGNVYCYWLGVNGDDVVEETRYTEKALKETTYYHIRG